MKNKMSKEEYEAAMLAVAKDFGARKITSAEALKRRREIRQKFKRGDVNAGQVG